MGEDTLLQRLLQEHAAHFTLTDEGKVQCELNGHTLPGRGDALAAFVNGKKFRKLREQSDVDEALKKYEPFLVPSHNFPHMIYCALTDDLVNRNMKEVKQHIKGKKFQRAKERFQNDKQGLHTEIDLLTSDVDEEGADEEGDGPGLWLPEEVLREHEMVDAGADEDDQGRQDQQQHGEMDADEGAEVVPGRGRADASTSMREDEQGQQQQKQRLVSTRRDSNTNRAAGRRAQMQQGQGHVQPAVKLKGKQQRQAAAQQHDGGERVGKVRPPKAKRARN